MNYYFLTAPQRDEITIATQQWCRKKLCQKSIRCITLQWFIDLDKEKPEYPQILWLFVFDFIVLPLLREMSGLDEPTQFFFIYCYSSLLFCLSVIKQNVYQKLDISDHSLRILYFSNKGEIKGFM